MVMLENTDDHRVAAKVSPASFSKYSHFPQKKPLGCHNIRHLVTSAVTI